MRASADLRWRKSHRVFKRCWKRRRRPLRLLSRRDPVRARARLTTDRSQKLKEAQSEAEKEIADIQAQKQKELEEFKKKVGGNALTAV